MRVAVALHDEIDVDVLAYAFERRGHQVLRINHTRGFGHHLPFEPGVVVLALGGTQAPDLSWLENARERFPHALLVATTERLRDPVTSHLLRAGAHEVVNTPYNPTELVLRCESLAGRTGGAVEHDGLRVADLDVQISRYHVAKNNQPLVMTKLEMRLLHCLCEHFPHLAPLDRLLTFGWEESGEPDPSLIKTHISHIRRKLAGAGGAPLQIISKQGVGYMLVES